MPGEDLTHALADALAPVLGPGLVIDGLRRLSGGASRETWSFDAVACQGERHPLILRRDPPGSTKGGMGMEAAVLVAAGDMGVPVPRLWLADDDPATLGAAFMIVERLDGETIARRILREPQFAPARPLLARQCGQILARLHQVDPARVPMLTQSDQLTSYRDTCRALGQPHPAFELAFRWLEANRPPATGTAVVHGDFRHGNLIIGPEGVRAVLDWELAHLGDPMEDLGWLCVKAWRYGVAPPVGGFGTYDELIDGYQSAGGATVDRDVLRWWEVFGTLKWGIICIMQAAAHTSGAVRSVELAAIGRRVCEQEWDLLEILP